MVHRPLALINLSLCTTFAHSLDVYSEKGKDPCAGNLRKRNPTASSTPRRSEGVGGARDPRKASRQGNLNFPPAPEALRASSDLQGCVTATRDTQVCLWQEMGEGIRTAPPLIHLLGHALPTHLFQLPPPGPRISTAKDSHQTLHTRQLGDRGLARRADPSFLLGPGTPLPAVQQGARTYVAPASRSLSEKWTST